MEHGVNGTWCERGRRVARHVNIANVLARWHDVLVDRKPGKSFTAEESTPLADQHVQAQVEFEPVDKQWVTNVVLSGIAW